MAPGAQGAVEGVTDTQLIGVQQLDALEQEETERGQRLTVEKSAEAAREGIIDNEGPDETTRLDRP